MQVLKNILINGKHNKPIITDVFYQATQKQKPIVIFCHGYKGFKDWGAWNIMATSFAQAGFCCVKFNFSHNGGTVAQPIDFPDLEAFGNNNYTKELDDLETVIDWLFSHKELHNEIDIDRISLLGHSRAGGIVCIKAEEDHRIQKVITLASVADFGKRTATSGELETWKKEGVKYVLNGRTQQQMPHYYQFYEDFIKNEKRLTIKRAISNLQIPILIIHGDKDTSILVEEGKMLHAWNAKSQLEIIKGADHVFGTKHPWDKPHLSSHLQSTVDLCITFLKA